MAEQRLLDLVPKIKELQVYKISARPRFKAAITIVWDNIFWMTDTSDFPPSENEKINAYINSHKLDARQPINLEDKWTLFKSLSLRDSDKLNAVIAKLIARFPQFSELPQDVAEELLSRARFVYYQPGVTIAREKRPATGVHFLLTGEVMTEREETDRFDPSKNTIVRQKYTQGMWMGDSPVIYNEPRNMTLTAVGHVETLFFKKHDYLFVLSKSVLPKLIKSQVACSQFSYFESWPIAAVREVVQRAVIKNFTKGSIMPMINMNGDRLVYFILEGSCYVVRRIVLRKVNLSEGGKFVTQYELHDDQTANTQKDDSLDSIYMRIMDYYKNSCFGLGEIAYNFDVVVEANVEALVLPQSLLKSYNYSNIWVRVQNALDFFTPSLKDIFEEFLRIRKWNKAKKEIVLECATDSTSSSHASIHDLPVSSRAMALKLSFPLQKRLRKHLQYRRGSGAASAQVVNTFVLRPIPPNELKSESWTGIVTGEDKGNYFRATSTDAKMVPVLRRHDLLRHPPTNIFKIPPSKPKCKDIQK